MGAIRMLSTVSALLNDVPWPLMATGGFIAVLLFAFLLGFVIPGFKLGRTLDGVERAFRQKAVLSTTELHTLFRPLSGLNHLWKEFYETLHEQRQERDGQGQRAVWRATVPAEAYFNAHNIVDSKLHTEFFKHFPGIFTGLGIIGTFAGLLIGLSEFKVSDDPAQVRKSLDALLHGVTEAFVVSATAIFLAMLVTLAEKGLLAWLYRRTHRLAERLDGLFAAGASEEYLSRLTVTSEEAATQAKQLKDALVGDLRAILQDLTDRQIQEARATTQFLGEQIRDGLHSSLQGPLQRLGGIVETASGDQSKAAAQLLQDVMASFSQRLNELFGGQIQGITRLNERTAAGMQDAVSALHQLVGNLESTGQRSTEAMADNMVRAVQAMEVRQATLSDQTHALVEQLRLQLSVSQTETQDKLREVVSTLGQQMGQMIAALQSQTNVSLSEHEKREDALVSRTSGVVASMSENVSAVVSQLATSSEQMRQSVAVLERTTTVSVGRLNESSQLLARSAADFAAAGDRVSGAMERTARLEAKVSEMAGALTASSSALQAVVNDYRASRDSMAAVASDLRSIVEAARREASMTEETLARLRAGAEILARAQRDADTYLEGVSNVLERTHSLFADNVTRTLDRANTKFHDKVGSVIALLHTSVQDLDEALSDLRDKN